MPKHLVGKISLNALERIILACWRRQSIWGWHIGDRGGFYGRVVVWGGFPVWIDKEWFCLVYCHNFRCVVVYNSCKGSCLVNVKGHGYFCLVGNWWRFCGLGMDGSYWLIAYAACCQFGGTACGKHETCCNANCWVSFHRGIKKGVRPFRALLNPWLPSSDLTHSKLGRSTP